MGSKIATSRSRRRLLIGSLGAATVAALAACTRPSRRPARLKIGILLPRSGYLAQSGNTCFEGVRLAHELLPSIGLPAFVALEGDTGEGLDTAVRAAERIIDEGAQLLIGCFDSGQTVEVAAVAERRRVPLVINIAAAPSISSQGYRYVFRNFPDATRIVSDSYDLQKQLFKATGSAPRRVVVMHINNGRGIEAIQQQFASMGMPYEMPALIPYDPKEPDLSAAVTAARASGADALWTVSRMDDAIRITRELIRQQGSPKIIMSSNAGLHDPPYRNTLKAYADYALTFAPFYDPNKPLSRALRAQQLRSNPGVPLGTLQIYSFEAVLVALDAYARADSSDGDALSAALRTTRITHNVSPGPGITFDDRGQNAGLHLVAIQNLQGEGRVVLPHSAAEAAPVFPVPGWDERG